MRALLLVAVVLACGVQLSEASIGTNVHPGRDCPALPASVEYVRLDRYLSEPIAPRFDACMAQLRAEGRQPIVTVVGDTNPATYAASLAALARQWTGTVWEIWNEQNHSTFWKGTQAEYMALLRAASPAIRAADPKATVLLGGLAWRGSHEWLRRAYRMGLRGLVDGVAVHPYTAPSVWPSALDNIRRIQWANHDPVPLWLTEFGEPGMAWPQAERIARDAIRRYPYVQTAVWYDLDADA